jgi:single-strand DNA-binding protein
MSKSKNKVFLTGHLGADPEVRYTGGGQAVANFNIATSESWTDKQSGEKKEKTEWHRCVAWGRLAELCGEYTHKGDRVEVEGKIQYREYTKDDITRVIAEIKLDDVIFPERPKGARDSAPTPTAPAPSARPAPQAQSKPAPQASRPAPVPSFVGDDEAPF